MTPSERQQLLDALLEGDITESDFLRLEAELSVDPQARREYYDRVTLSMLLEAEATAARAPGVHTPPSSAVTGAVWQRWRQAFAVASVLMTMLLIVVSWQFNIWSTRTIATGPPAQQPGSGNESAEPLAAGFAVVSGQADAVWADGRSLADGSLVPPGELHLKSGAVQFELFSGVTLVAESESRFTILSSMEVAVAQGKVRARVPEPAQGFRLLTGAGEVVDLGTEFAVNVTDDGSEVHVLDGEIQWHPKGLPPQRMEQGEAARYSSEGQVHMAARSEDFIGPHEMRERLRSKQATRFDRWLLQNQQRRNDPRLLAFYQITPDDVSSRLLLNHAAGAGVVASEGAVVAAASASSRWGQADNALDFSPAGSRVRLSVPGEHQSLTLLCWVKINSLDRWYNSLFLTDGHEVGEPHWQIMDDGRLFFAVKKRDLHDHIQGKNDKHIFFSPPFWRSELSGQWLMIATVYDVESRTVSHFLNGELLSQETIPDEFLVERVSIGNASIGNWGLPAYRKDPEFAVRNLNGSLDEFALYGAALPAEEIRKLYHDGKP